MEENIKKPVKPKNFGASQYKKNVEIGLSNVEKLIKVYDLAIYQLEKKDADGANKAITELIMYLNFHRSTPQDVRKLATDFLSIYQFCKSQIRQEKFDVARKMLVELRDAWKQSNQTQKEERTKSLQK